MTQKEFSDIISLELNYDIFEAHSFICEIIRHKEFLHLNGYIYIYSSHPWYKKHYDDIHAEVHGGLTFAEMDNDIGYWRIGFDTNHFDDLSMINFLMSNQNIIYSGSYKDWNYVKNEVQNLAYQASLFHKTTFNIDAIIAKKLLNHKSVWK